MSWKIRTDALVTAFSSFHNLESYNLGQKGLRILKTGVILRTTS